MKKLALLALLSGAAVASQAQSFTSFDSISNVARGYGGASTNRQLMGQAFNFGGGASGVQSVTGMDLILFSGAAATYSALQLQVTFFDTYTPGGAATATAFSNAIGTYTIDFNVGTGLTTTANSLILIGSSATAGTPSTPGITFGVPVAFTGTSNKGVQLIWRGNTGSGLAITNNLSTAIRGAAADTTNNLPAENPYAVGTPASGAAPTWGYFRNASNAAPTTTATSLINSDGRQVGDNSGLAIRFYSATPVPEPASLAVLGLGALGLIRRRRNKKA